ncbi:MAG: hypothetical protein WCB27_05910 [Thermoguttaceae bacterium]
MPESNTDLSQYLEKVPKPDEIRRQLTANLRQAKLLRQLLRIAEQRDAVAEVSSCK